MKSVSSYVSFTEQISDQTRIHSFCSFMSDMEGRQQVSGRTEPCCPTFDLVGCGTLIHGAVGDGLLWAVVAVTCSSSHATRAVQKRRWLLHTSPPVALGKKEMGWGGREAWVTTGDRDEFREDNNGSMIWKWKRSWKLPRGLFWNCIKPRFALRLHNKQHGFKDIAQRSRNVLNHPAQAPAPAAAPTPTRAIIQHKPALSGIPSAHFTFRNTATVRAASEAH